MTSLVVLAIGGLVIALTSYLHKSYLVWTLVDVLVASYVMIVALFSLLRSGPYVGTAAGGFCLPGHGGATCYVAYPTSIIVFSIFLLILSVEFPKAAIPVVAFAISFGELLFAPEGAIAATLYPHILTVSSLSPYYTLSVRYFDPGIEAVWISCVVAMPLVLWRQGHKIGFTIWFPIWFVILVGFEFFLPYYHTTWWSILVSNAGMAGQCFVVWRLFGFNETRGVRIPRAAGPTFTVLQPRKNEGSSQNG